MKTCVILLIATALLAEVLQEAKAQQTSAEGEAEDLEDPEDLHRLSSVATRQMFRPASISRSTWKAKRGGRDTLSGGDGGGDEGTEEGLHWVADSFLLDLELLLSRPSSIWIPGRSRFAFIKKLEHLTKPEAISSLMA
ncbi:unnamed protein product [Cyprideis torosa]|uniref:Uncharacterized protein n=1 Tax=Cyprideis torosa TaxID=163714 RepID=A0A7R8WC56_9CRUS|nr:unnamed protein product [Cyprideis torosa]CAG0892874.1 unnamed protein product [Cyprideis torosa]